MAVVAESAIGAGNGGALRPTKGAWAVFLPMVLWLGVFVLLPNLLMVVCAFLEPGEVRPVEFRFSTEAVRRVLDPLWFRILGVSIGYAAATTAITLAAGFPVAWYIGRSSPRRRSILMTVLMIPFWTSFLVRSYGWITILKEEGALTATMRSIGLMRDGGLLYTPAAVLIGLVHSYLPFMILPLIGSIEKLDGSLIEAARDLGAGAANVFFRVILPLVFPGIAAGVMLVFVPAIGMFAVSDLLGGARVPMIGNVIQNQFGAARHWPFGAALGVTLLIMFSACWWFAGTKRSAE